ncbi:hypothetical protein AcV7_001818 [Taiwanofungus camphoratus]|nr:hypothetical protein AcV7_001818 [Antrodia cinnamomea]
MNSYPPELLTQFAPVMFVAGLDLPPPSSGGKVQDPFIVLSYRLREALLQQRKVAIWQPEKNKTFQVVLVDKSVRFPPRKLVNPDDSQQAGAHSPLSPLTPSSPVYPDGLIAPIWVRKHTTLVPAVFVLFTKIFDWYVQQSSVPPDGGDSEREKERETEERRRDAELSTELALRKKSTGERGIKLTVVLMASRRMLDDPSLDTRLTYIRRQSGLDPRAALFVLSPVTQPEIGDFVRSLQEALYDPAMEYYTNHSKRVRRKRNRHSQSTPSYPVLPHSPASGVGAARPLRPEGWTVRYEYKMACFAEFRGEDEVALKHYQDACSTLILMFGSTAILPPRTKRWAEAKVLADCINLKICKLYLYNNEHSLALSHHNSHMRKFADFSRGWGIGEETFEFWSWLARQHRVFAELLEQGTRSSLKIPSHFATPLTAAAGIAAQAVESGNQRNPMEVDAMRMPGLNPNQALQHPGFYYYMAARCTERRRERFLRALEAESEERITMASPGYANEKKVDHLALILELYTRSYELFKTYNPASGHGQGRLTLWIAFRIAQTYYDSGKFDMAVRFFERIAKTYRRERWDSLLCPLLSTWYSCAQQMGDTELSVRLLFEMLGHGVRTQQDDPDATQEDLLAVLKSTVPSCTDETFIVDALDSEQILDSSVVFWKHEVTVDEPVAFQISLTGRPTVSMSSLPFSSLIIHFSADIPPITVRHSPFDGELLAIQKVDLGSITIPAGSESEGEGKEVECNLRWGPGGMIIFTGSLSSDSPVVIKITKLVLCLQEGKWSVEIPLHPVNARHGSFTSPRWLISENPVQFKPIRRDHYSTATVRHRPHQVHISLSHYSPAYLIENFPINMEITNEDDRELDVIVDILLQPTESEGTVNYISFGDERSSSLIKGVALGVLAPGVSVLKALYLTNTAAVGDRTIDISVQTRAISSVGSTSPVSPESPSAPIVADRYETLRTILIPVVEPIKVEYQTVYRRSLAGQPGLADLRTYTAEFWDDGDGGEAEIMSLMTCLAPSGVVVEGIKLNRQDCRNAKVLDSAIDEHEESFLTELLPGDEICDYCRISLALDAQHLQTDAIAGLGAYEISWRRILPDGSHGSLSICHFPLPPLRPPNDGLIALLDAPPTAKLHNPIPLRLTIRNRHPIRSANITVHLEPDNADAFVVAGLRSGRMPILLPGGEDSIVWKLIPVECGFVKVPKIRVVDLRKAVDGAHSQSPLDLGTAVESEGDIVCIVDVRWEGKRQADDRQQGRSSIDSAKARSGDENSQVNEQPVVLVLP